MSALPPNEASTLTASENARWFTEEIQPHESSLRAFLRRGFPSVGDVDDTVQESYLRLLRARPAHPIRSAKAFLFTVARRLALDTLRHKRCTPIDCVGQLDALPVLDDQPDVADKVSRRERISLFADAIAERPAGCRDVFILHKIQGLTRRETAARLGIAEKTVETHIASAMKRCGLYLRRRLVTALTHEEE